ncbi:MAG: YraN family protein [Oscillospiraceae bacterium]|nr:YraN family protein [Oscillospiraceae bacterium]
MKQTRGEFGELAACEHLVSQNYDIIARNYRKRCGEIDIVALNAHEVVFVEVKCRKYDSLVEGIESVNHTKQAKIEKTAKAFLAENPQFYEMNARFDVIQVTITTDNSPQLLTLTHYKDAFNPALL